MRIGFAVCGSFCTYSAVFPVMEKLAKEHDVYPIFSCQAAGTDTRFGKAEECLSEAERITGHPVLKTIPQAELHREIAAGLAAKAR